MTEQRDTVRIQVASDLHTEFHRDAGIRLLSGLPVAAETLVVAGDLGTVETLPTAVQVLCDRFSDVVYVAGNHEYYGARLEAAHDVLSRLSDRHRNFHWLNRTTVEVSGLRFGGATLWFRDGPANEMYASMLNDFHMIRDFRDWVYRENDADLCFFASTLAGLDVAVTHHLPAPGSIDPAFATSPLNRFFLCDLTPLLAAAPCPPAWVHGHTHASCAWDLDASPRPAGHPPMRVVCNPFGYPNELNPGFVPGLVVEVTPRRGSG